MAQKISGLRSKGTERFCPVLYRDEGEGRGKENQIVAEMSGFLQSYTEMKEKAEEEKIKLLLKCQVLSSLIQR